MIPMWLICEKHGGKKSEGGMGVKKRLQLQPRLLGTAVRKRGWKEMLILKSSPIKC